MVKLIHRVRKDDESALYLHFYHNTWLESQKWPCVRAYFCFPWQTKTEKLDLDYFSQDARSSYGFDIDPVAYRRPGSHITHHYNPVTHFKLNGSILADEAPEERVMLDQNGDNLFSSSRYVPVVPILPGGSFTRAWEKVFYSEQQGRDVIFKGTIEIRRSKIRHVTFDTSYGPFAYTQIDYRLMAVDAPFEEYNSASHQFGAQTYAGSFLLFNPEGSSYPGRAVMFWCNDTEGLKPKYYINRHSYGATWQLLGTIKSNASLSNKRRIREIVPSRGEPSWMNHTSLGRMPVFYELSGPFVTSAGTKIHPSVNQEAIDCLRHWEWSSLENYLHHVKDPLEWNHLCYSALQNIGEGAQVNGIAFVKDAIEMGPTVKAFISTLRSIPSKKVKAVASAWLAVHYGFKLTVLDSKELYQELTQSKHSGFGLSNARSMRKFWINSSICVTTRYQIIYDRFRNLTEILNGFLREIDFTMSLENIWDMIPFSFVIDWFVSVGDMFNALDNYYNVRSYYTTAAAGQSITMTGPANILDRSVTDLGALEISMYIRAYQKSPVIPIPSHTTVTPLSHWIEGAALIIANR